MWSEGATLLLGRRPWGFKGQDARTGVVGTHLPAVQLRGLVMAQLGWHDLSVADPFSASGRGAGADVPLGLVDIETRGAQALHARVFTCSRVRQSGVLFSLVWQGLLDPGCEPADLLKTVESEAGQRLELLACDAEQTSDLIPGTELEVKYTLSSEVSPWDLATTLTRAVHAGRFTDFRTDLGHEIERWTYEQSTFQIFREGVSCGYVGFMKIRPGRFHVKYKLFEYDGLRRTETFDKSVDLDSAEFESYLGRKLPDCTIRALPTMVRSRFDVLVVSLRTGHYFGLETDEVQAGGRTMRQLEVEYHQSQQVPDVSEDTIEEELDRLGLLVAATLDEAGIAYSKGYTSKLTWLLTVDEEKEV